MGTKKGVTSGQHSFAQIPRAEIQRSSFNRSCGVKTTFDAGQLIPIFVDEALPGDTFNLRMHLFSRISTLLFPIMDNIYMDVFFFAVPNRLLWDNWEKFNGAQDNPGDSVSFLVPEVFEHLTNGNVQGSLSDYLGVPIGNTATRDLRYSAFWHRAYNLIWNEWFRDENLQNSLVEHTDNGPQAAYTDYTIQKRGKRHDYFTSCLPFPQKGTAVTLPIGSVAPVVATTANDPSFDVDDATDIKIAGAAGVTNAIWSASSTAGGNATWNTTGLEADLSSATASTINSIREAFQIQKLLERDARGGTRYTEIIKSHFGVTSPDQRLQRPEYLGGGSVPIMMTPVAATNESANVDLGELAAFGVAQGGGIGFTKSFVEHCVILGLVASRADLNYQQGLDRMFSRSTKLDFYWPALAHLGEQAVLNKEIFTDDLGGTNEGVFGYQERYAEYRYKPSKVTGIFRSAATGSLDTWHVAQDFATLPVLDATFIRENPPIDRVVAIPTEPHFLFDAFFDFKCARPMPTYSVPGLIDHF